MVSNECNLCHAKGHKMDKVWDCMVVPFGRYGYLCKSCFKRYGKKAGSVGFINETGEVFERNGKKVRQFTQTVPSTDESQELGEVGKVLMERDGLSHDEALARVQEARRAIQELLEADPLAYTHFEEFMLENFGLEPDYLLELI